MERIYLDHAATTYVIPQVFTCIKPYLEEEFGNASALYAEGREAKAALSHARGQVARALFAKEEEIFFTSGGTESDNWAIKGAFSALSRRGRHIITTKVEHPAVLNTCRELERMGARVTYLDVDSTGRVSARDVLRAMRGDTILVSVMFANNEVGSVNPIEEIGEAVHRAGVLFHTDAVQAAGHIPVDVDRMHIDLLSLSGHKFYAPKGVGALYVREGTPLRTMIHGGAQESGKRAGTENIAGFVGLGAALEIALAERPAESARIAALRDEMAVRVLKEIPDCSMNGHPRLRLPGNLNLSFVGARGADLVRYLDEESVSASAGSACSSCKKSVSHVLSAMRVPADRIGGSVRFSFGRCNKEEEIPLAVEALKRAVSRARQRN